MVFKVADVIHTVDPEARKIELLQDFRSEQAATDQKELLYRIGLIESYNFHELARIFANVHSERDMYGYHKYVDITIILLRQEAPQIILNLRIFYSKDSSTDLYIHHFGQKPYDTSAQQPPPIQRFFFILGSVDTHTCSVTLLSLGNVDRNDRRLDC
nr:unnamed protein product [Callosobruchus chinensis]